MTAHVLTGSKQEIAQKVAAMEGEVREAIVFIEEPSDLRSAGGNGAQNVEDMFAEMEQYMVQVEGC